MAAERDNVRARGPETRWVAKEIRERWKRFYEQETSAKALTRLEFTEHIAYLLFLKLDHERAQRTGMFASQPIAPADSWSRLVRASGEELHRVLAGLMAELGKPNPQDPRRAIASVVFQDSRPWNVDRMAELGRLIIEEFDPYRWSNVDRDELGAAFSLLIADCRDDIRAKRGTGQFLTPPPLLKVIAKALALTPQDRVIDAAAGVGTSLIAAHREMAAHGERVDAAAIAGADIDVQMCRLATMNVLLNTGRQFHDVPPILRADSLKAREFAVRRHERDVAASVVICNPPFRSNVEANTEQRDDFWAQNATLPANFLQHLAITLPQGARAAVFVPDGVLVHGGAAVTIRRALLKNCDVHTLLRLPTGMFYDTGSKTNVLFFTKSVPRPTGEPATDELWVYDARDRHHTDTENPLTEDDFAEFLEAYRPGEEASGRTESRRFKRYDRDAVRKILESPGAGLDLKADIADAPEDFGDPRDIARSIVDHLGDAQRSFQAVLDSLG